MDPATDATHDARDVGLVVELFQQRKSMMRRRSSLAVAPPAIPEHVVAPTATPPELIAGDQTARPHFLKDRSVTMRESVRLSTSSSRGAASGHQSKASAFLSQLLELSRTAAAVYDNKASSSSNQQPAADTNRSSHGDVGDPGLVPQTRRQSIVISPSHVTKLNQMQQQNAMQAPLAPPRPSMPSGSIDPLLVPSEDANEYVTEDELQQRPLAQLVLDLGLYKKKHGTLLRILNEIQRRLHDAEIESSTNRSSHITMCRDLVDDGLLSGVVLVLREFRFHVALQTAAVALLSFIADVSDLYAYMMAELDIEPLVQKIVAVHVSQERLVMNGSSLIHTISESKHKAQVVKMYKARQLEMERKRAASFVEAFVAERKHSKMRGPDFGRCATPTSRGASECTEFTLSASRWQRSALSRDLGVPPVLTAHYDLKVAFTRSRANRAPPLQRLGEDGSELSIYEDETRDMTRPRTSPEPSRLTSLSSASKLAAAYLTSPTFVAPSPMGKRSKAKRVTHSATGSSRKSIQLAKRCDAVQTRNSIPTSSSPMSDHDQSSSTASVTTLENDRLLQKPIDAESSPDKASCPAGASHTNNGLSDEETNYDDDEFVNDGDGESSDATEVNRDRLLPVGSDSDLFDLVDLSEAGALDNDGQSDKADGVDSGSESPRFPLDDLATAIGACGVSETTTSLSDTEDRLTSELVGLLNTCVNSEDPSFLRRNDESFERTALSGNKKRNETVALRSSTYLCAPSPSVVRPVSRRILAHSTKTTRRQRASQTASENCTAADSKDLMAMAQITTMLDKFQDPSEANAVDKGASESDPVLASVAIGLPHSPVPASTPTSSIAQIQTLYARGLQHHKANELDAAVRYYEQGIHLQHSSGVQREFASLYINLGSARMAQQRPYDALVAFTQAERIQPSNVKALFNAGLVLMQLSQWEEAITKFEKVVEIDSSHVRAQCALEQCQRSVVRTTRA